jgi:hypothetical protein
MATLESLNTLLSVAAKLLDEAAREIRDVPLEPREPNICRIGDSLASIYEIQHHIYALRPDLMPEYLRDTKLAEANSRLAQVLTDVRQAIEANDLPNAAKMLRAYVVQEPSEIHRGIAESELKNLGGAGA